MMRASVRAALDSVVKKAAGTFSVEAIMFSLDEAFDAVSQVKLELTQSSLPVRGTMLGKRSADDVEAEDKRLNEIKAHTRCRACKKVGHWFQDREECLKIMAERRRVAEERKRRSQADGSQGTGLRSEPLPDDGEKRDKYSEPRGSLFP